jgi:tRNA pseudouridine32 synthase/23S rRNA pseudouridine746 synthase
VTRKLNSPLPLVEGVAPSYQRLPAAGKWKTVLEFLAEKFPHVEAAAWRARMAKGEIADETGLRLDAQSAYRAGACVFYYREPDAETRIPFAEKILFQDENLLVADKPHFLPVIPAGRFLRETLLVRLKKSQNLEHLVPLHRLDRETAGIVLFSVNPETRGFYSRLFNDRKVTKIYHALAGVAPQLEFPLTHRSRMTAGEPFFRMRETDGNPNSETLIELKKKINDDASLYELKAVTGKKHQIRLHMASLGIPIINDKFYPEMNDSGADDDFSAPLKLLAKSVSFRDPLTGENLFFESERTLE